MKFGLNNGLLTKLEITDDHCEINVVVSENTLYQYKEKNQDTIESYRESVLWVKEIVSIYKDVSDCSEWDDLKDFDFEPRMVEVFLQWEVKPQIGANLTYLEIPDTLEFGRFILPCSYKVWKEERLNGIRYKCDGVLHPFQRDEKFMHSRRALQSGTIYLTGS